MHQAGSIRLPGRAGLLLYTDGLTEARRDDSFFGIEGVSAVLGALDDPSPSEAIAVLRARVADFAYGTLTDDLCMLAARVSESETQRGPAAAGPLRTTDRPAGG